MFVLSGGVGLVASGVRLGELFAIESIVFASFFLPTS